MRQLAAFAVCAVSAMVFASAQTPPPARQPTFRAGVDVVQLDVSVLDKNHRPVRGLTAADFTVLEDGKPQHVVAFQPFDIPDRVVPPVAWMRDIAPDVATNRELNGRLVVVVIAGMPGRDYFTSATATRIADTILNQLGPDDLTAVVYEGDNEKAQGFTADRARLLTALTDIKRAAPRPFNTKGRCGLAYRLLDELVLVSQMLQDDPQRRKTMLLVAPSFRIDLAERNPCWLQEYNDLLRNAQRGNINIYGIDPGRLLSGWQMPMEHEARSAPPVALNARLAGSDGLRTLAEATGGRAIVNDEQDQPETEVPVIFEENSSYYLLGFKSTNANTDGRLRRLDVTVDRPDVEVRTRTGYFAGPAKRAASNTPSKPLSPIEESVVGVLPMTATPLRMSAAAFAVAKKPGAAVAIALSVRSPTAASGATQHVSVLANAFDLEGQPVAFERQTLNVSVSPNPGGMPFEILSRLALPPGRYDVRVGVQIGEEQPGSVYAFVDVPNFAKDDLSLSGLVFERTRPLTVASERGLVDLLPVVPTTARDFARTDRVAAFLRAYQGGGGRLAPAQVVSRVVNDQDETVFEQKTPLGEERFGQGRAADYHLDLPLARLIAGDYLLTLDVTLGKRDIRRDVRFTVR